MRILATTPTYPPYNSGLGNAVQQQVIALAAGGHSMTVATGGAQKARRQDPDSGATVEEFPVSGSDSILQPLRGDVPGYQKFLRDADFDVILLNAWQTWSTDIPLKILPSIRGRKYLYSNCVSTNLFLRRQPIRSGLRYLAWRPYMRRMPDRMRSLDGLIFVADEGCDSRFDDLRLARKIGKRFAVIPNAFSRLCLPLAEPSDTDLQGRNQLIAVGSYDWFKGHDFALRAYAGSEAKTRFPLHIHGPRFTDFTSHLRRLAAGLGLEAGQVVFHENTPKDVLLEEYGRSLAMISGSHTECQPLVLLDAMAKGTPFVARACGCIPRLPGGQGVRSEKEASRALDAIVRDPQEWGKLSSEGLRAAASTYHPEVVGGQLAEFLTQRA